MNFQHRGDNKTKKLLSLPFNSLECSYHYSDF